MTSTAWIRTNEGLFKVTCNMKLKCGGVEGGWMQVVDVDMNQNNSCPENTYIRILRSPLPRDYRIAKIFWGVSIHWTGILPGLDYWTVLFSFFGQVSVYIFRKESTINKYLATIDDCNNNNAVD